MTLRRKSRVAESIVQLREACSLTLLSQHKAEFVYALGVSQIMNADYKGAIASLEEALKIFSSTGDSERYKASLFNRAVAYFEIGEGEYAKEQVISLLTDLSLNEALSVSANNFLAQMENLEGQFSQAYDRAQKILQSKTISPSQRLIALESLVNSSDALGILNIAETSVQQMYELVSKYGLDQLISKVLLSDLSLAKSLGNSSRLNVLKENIENRIDEIPVKYQFKDSFLFVSE